MATPVGARMASARGAVGMHKCWGDPRHWFAATTPAGRVVDARTTGCVNVDGQFPLWPPRYAHEWPVHAARLGCTFDGGTPDIGLDPPRPAVASWTHALPGVWTYTAQYLHGHPNTRTNGQCSRCGCDAQKLGGPSTLVCLHHACLLRRGRTHYPVRGRLGPHTSMATPVHAQMESAHGAVGMHRCWRDPGHWFAPTTFAGRVVHARTTRCLDVYGHIRLWPPQYAHDRPVHAARLGCTNVGGTPDIGLRLPRPLVASWTHALPGVWTSMATYFYSHPGTCTNGHCKRSFWDAQKLIRFLPSVGTHHTRWSRRRPLPYP